MAIKNDADKKKMLILGVLVVAICGVGAFQFIGGSSNPAPAAKKEKKEADNEPAKGPIQTANSVASAGNSATANANAAMPNARVTDVKAEAEATANISEDDPIRKLYAYKLPVRDPFADTTNPQIATPTQQTPPPQNNKPAPRNNPPKREIGGSISPWDPSGSVPGLPGVGQGGATANLQLDGGFNWHMSGMIEGARPAVVFSDDQGNQKLVAAGGAIDPDSKLVSVSNGKVVVSHKGKKITLTMGGKPDAK